MLSMRALTNGLLIPAWTHRRVSSISLGYSLVLACYVLCLCSTTVHAADLGAAEAEATSLLSRIQESDRADLLAISDLMNASVQGGLMVEGFNDSKPLYSLHPIAGSDHTIIGLVAVGADSDEWSWYTFGYRGEQYPPVARAIAMSKAEGHASILGRRVVWQEPQVVALKDKHLYWSLEGQTEDEDCTVLVSLDDLDARPLSTLDESLTIHLNSLPSSPRPSVPPPGYRLQRAQAAPLPRPDVHVIGNVPFHFQITSWFCGPASVQMLLDFYGEEISQQDISGVQNDDSSFGTYTDDNLRSCHFSGMSTSIQDAALQGYDERDLGYAANEAWFHDDAYNLAKDCLFAGYPMEICTCYDGGCTEGHFRVLKGYDDALGEFIVHDPWYTSPFWGPDLHFNQAFLVESLWDPWTWCWALMTGPWEFDLTVPEQVTPGETFMVGVDIFYPGSGPFFGQYPTSSATATIHLPSSLTLMRDTGTVSLPTLASGDSAHVEWEVMASEETTLATIHIGAKGIVDGWSGSYGSYADSIGGHATAVVEIGDLDLPEWTADERITNDPAASTVCFPSARAMVAEPSGVAHIVWADAQDGNSEIYYRRWEQEVWGSPVRLTNDTGHSANPAIALGTAGDLHVVWTEKPSTSSDQNVYYKKWNGSWSAETQLSSHTNPDLAPAIAVDGLGRVHVVWQGCRGMATMYTEILYRRWDGMTWSPEAYVGGSGGRSAYMPSLAAGPTGEVHLVYAKDLSGRIPGEIYYRKHDGVDWSTRLALTGAGARAHAPSIALGSESDIHVVWHDGQHPGGGICYRVFDGAEWRPEVGLVHDWDAQFASVAVDPNGTAHIVWEDYRNETAEIYYNSWNGDWSGDYRVTRERVPSILPCFALNDAGHGYLVWTDARDGNTEIYFKRRESTLTDVSEDLLGSTGHAICLIRTIWPVPSTIGTTVEFELRTDGRAKLAIFDVRGRLVKTLLDATLPAGVHFASWDQTDRMGADASQGVYFCRLVVGEQEETRPIVLIRR